MNENPLNWIVKLVVWIVDTLAEATVALFDGLRRTMFHANPSVFAFLATVLPLILPLPVAWMTSHSAQEFFSWDPWAANVLGFGLEGLGLLAWVFAVEAYITKRALALFASVAVAYELTLIFLNVALAANAGVSLYYVVVLLLICFLPALSAVMYGNMRLTAELELKRQDAERKAEAEKIRQERRQDRKEAAALRQQYAADTKQVKEDGHKPRNFRKPS